MQCYTDLKPPRIFITSWALDSYLELVPCEVSAEEYWSTLRPDILRLTNRTTDPKFNNSLFWGPAQSGQHKDVPCAFKMKWHNMGHSKIQLRLGIIEHKGDYYLCHAWSKTSSHMDYRNGAQLAERRRLIIKNPCDHIKGALHGPST
ncbi:MAG: hypothetical protein RIT28_4841 [Pseudomonadota bacterium]|jgi:hypothetical protein